MKPLLLSVLVCLATSVSSDETVFQNETYVFDKVPGEPMTYDEATAYCHRMKGFLPSLHSKSQLLFLHDIAKRVSNDDMVFLGMTARPGSDEWTWDDGSAMDSFIPSSMVPDVCTRNFLTISECRLAIVVKVGDQHQDKRITAAWLKYARTSVRLCKVAPRL